MKKKFSENIRADKDAFYMSIPEVVAIHVAEQLKEYDSAVELCCAVGMMCVQLAQHVPKVIGIDNNAQRLKDARYNAALYGVADKIQFVRGDVLDEKLLSSIQTDVAILDPDWSEENRSKNVHATTLQDMQPNLAELIKMTRHNITNNLVIRLPKTIEPSELEKFGTFRAENIYIDNELKFKVAYFLPEVHRVEVGDVFLNALA